MLQLQQSQEPAFYFAGFRAGSGSNLRMETSYIMTYKQSLKPWAVARLLPQGKWVIIGRYRSASDANGHLQLLRLRVPNLQFKVVFDQCDRSSGCARRD